MQVTRPGNALLSAIGLGVGAVASGVDAFLASDPVTLAAALATAATGTAFGNTLNDLHDEVLDRTAHPRRPLPSGRLTRGAAWNLALLLWLATIALAALVSPSFLLVTVLLLALLFAYERNLKLSGLVGNIAVAVAAGALFPLGALAVPGGALHAPLALGLIAALAHLGRELLKDAEDVLADRNARRTFAVRHGRVAAARLGAAFLATAVVVSPLPHYTSGWSSWFLLALIPADLLFLWAAYQGRHAPAAGRRFAKGAMVLALVAFAVGAWL